MQPHSKHEADDGHSASVPRPQPLQPELEQLISRITAMSHTEKNTILYRLLRELLGEQPEREYGIYHPDGSSFVFLLPPALRVQLDLTPERLAEFDRSSEFPGRTTPLTDLVARLKSREP